MAVREGWRVFTATPEDEACVCRSMSSANNNSSIREKRSEGNSAIIINQTVGLRTEPCGTLLDSKDKFETEFSTRTEVDLSIKNLRSQGRMPPPRISLKQACSV